MKKRILFSLAIIIISIFKIQINVVATTKINIPTGTLYLNGGTYSEDGITYLPYAKDTEFDSTIGLTIDTGNTVNDTFESLIVNGDLTVVGTGTMTIDASNSTNADKCGIYVNGVLTQTENSNIIVDAPTNPLKIFYGIRSNGMNIYDGNITSKGAYCGIYDTGDMNVSVNASVSGYNIATANQSQQYGIKVDGNATIDGKMMGDAGSQGNSKNTGIYIKNGLIVNDTGNVEGIADTDISINGMGIYVNGAATNSGIIKGTTKNGYCGINIYSDFTMTKGNIIGICTGDDQIYRAGITLGLSQQGLYSNTAVSNISGGKIEGYSKSSKGIMSVGFFQMTGGSMILKGANGGTFDASNVNNATAAIISGDVTVDAEASDHTGINASGHFEIANGAVVTTLSKGGGYGLTISKTSIGDYSLVVDGGTLIATAVDPIILTYGDVITKNGGKIQAIKEVDSLDGISNGFTSNNRVAITTEGNITTTNPEDIIEEIYENLIPFEITDVGSDLSNLEIMDWSEFTWNPDIITGDSNGKLFAKTANMTNVKVTGTKSNVETVDYGNIGPGKLSISFNVNIKNLPVTVKIDADNNMAEISTAYINSVKSNINTNVEIKMPITIVAPNPKPGYIFSNWTVSAGDDYDANSLGLIGDLKTSAITIPAHTDTGVNLTANYIVAPMYQLIDLSSIDLYEGGFTVFADSLVGTESPYKVQQGDKVKITAKNVYGYMFDSFEDIFGNILDAVSVVGTISGSNTIEFTMPDSDVSLRSIYTKVPDQSGSLTHTVTFVDFDNSIIATESVEDGNNLKNIPEPKREGLVFTGWAVNNTTNMLSLDMLKQIEITLDMVLKAMYADPIPTKK